MTPARIPTAPMRIRDATLPDGRSGIDARFRDGRIAAGGRGLPLPEGAGRLDAGG